MLANVMFASKPRIRPTSLRKIFFSLPSAAHWWPTRFQPCVLRFILFLKCLFLTKTIACSFSLGREDMLLIENMGKTNASHNFSKAELNAKKSVSPIIFRSQ